MNDQTTTSPLQYRGRKRAAVFLFLVALLGLVPLALLVVATMDPTTTLSLVALCLFCTALILPLTAVLLALAWAELVSRVELGSHGFSFTLPSLQGYVPLPPVRRAAGPWSHIRSIRSRSVSLRWGWLIRYGYAEYLIAIDTGELGMTESMSRSASDRQSIPTTRIVETISRHAGIPIRPARDIDRGGFIRAILSRATPWTE